MKEQERYNSLKRAMQRQDRKIKLSTNFTYTTMQRVNEVAAAREKRENKIQFFAIAVAAMLIIIGGGYIVAPMIKDFTFSFGIWNYFVECRARYKTTCIYCNIYIVFFQQFGNFNTQINLHKWFSARKGHTAAAAFHKHFIL